MLLTRCGVPSALVQVGLEMMRQRREVPLDKSAILRWTDTLVNWAEGALGKLPGELSTFRGVIVRGCVRHSHERLLTAHCEGSRA